MKRKVPVASRCRAFLARAVFAMTACFLVAVSVTPTALAHPEDELCTIEGGMDPALCRELARLDQKKPGPVAKSPGPVVEVSSYDRSAWQTAAFYVSIGFEHILPKGLDHILFVLALFLSSRRVRPLLWQISAFTLAHTATLGLAAAGVIAPSPDWVEPLIAATIAWAALENILFKEPTSWRPVLVFGFGLIHGMGFAGVFGDLGLPENIFWPALLGFNVGVEIGQLTIIGMAFAVAVGVRFALKSAGKEQLYHSVLVVPVSGLIACIGVFWAIQRAFFGG